MLILLVAFWVIVLTWADRIPKDDTPLTTKGAVGAFVVLGGSGLWLLGGIWLLVGIQ